MNENDSYVLLDVRTPEEFSHIRMNDAILMSDYEIMERAEVELDKNDIILVYCQSGRRSAEVTHELIALGFKRVYDIGGIVDWPWPQDLIKE
jgi:rhodanese-related sulfurtransferase